MFQGPLINESCPSLCARLTIMDCRHIKFINRLRRAITINTLLNYLVRSKLENVCVMFLFSGFMVLVCGSVHKPDNIEDEPL